MQEFLQEKKKDKHVDEQQKIIANWRKNRHFKILNLELFMYGKMQEPGFNEIISLVCILTL